MLRQALRRAVCSNASKSTRQHQLTCCAALQNAGTQPPSAAPALQWWATPQLLQQRAKHGSARKEPKKIKKAVKGGKAAAPGKKGAARAADDSDDDADEQEADSDDSGNESDEPVYNTVDDLVPLPQLKERLNRVLEGLKKDLAVLRGGRVDPGTFDHLTVHSYGQEGPLSSVAQVSVKGPQLLVLTCYDPASAPAVLEAVRDSGMNLNPQIDGNTIRVPIPKASQETRENMGKVASKAAEKAKSCKLHQSACSQCSVCYPLAICVGYRSCKDAVLWTNANTLSILRCSHPQIDNIVSKMEAACVAALEAKKAEILAA
eukprot:2579-Heterococcus_DN1.PRE.1